MIADSKVPRSGRHWPFCGCFAFLKTKIFSPEKANIEKNGWQVDLIFSNFHPVCWGHSGLGMSSSTVSLAPCLTLDTAQGRRVLKAWRAWQAWKHENGRISFHWKLKNSQRRTLKREFQVRAVRNLWTFRGSDVNEVQSFAQWNVHSVEWVIPQMLCNAVFSCTAQVMKTHGSFGPCWRHSHISDLADLSPKYDRCLSPYWTLSKPNPSEIKLKKLNQIHKFHTSILI